MWRLACLLCCLVLLFCSHGLNAQSGGTATLPELGRILTFEIDHPRGTPGGWGGGPAGTIFVDETSVHSGRWAARLERTPESPDSFASMTKSIPMDFAGKTIELRGFLRTEGVGGYAALWLRQDGETGSVAFDNMKESQPKGTNAWAQYSVTLSVRPEARTLFFGVLLAGTGKVWADDLELLVDGKPLWEAPRFEQPKTVLDRDHEFDRGSGVVLNELTPLQIENLAVLGKVWGFLKYHHPVVTQGTRHWDYELFRVFPSVLAARDRAAANAALDAWVARLGAIGPCETCARLEENTLHLRPALGWIADERRLGADLSTRLRAIHRNRPANGQQFYVSLQPGVLNPSLNHELGYGTMPLPDAGFQILAAYRFWNVITYWFPYRDVMGEDWDGVLARFLPRIALAKSIDAYKLEMMHSSPRSTIPMPTSGVPSMSGRRRVIARSLCMCGSSRTARWLRHSRTRSPEIADVCLRIREGKQGGGSLVPEVAHERLGPGALPVPEQHDEVRLRAEEDVARAGPAHALGHGLDGGIYESRCAGVDQLPDRGRAIEPVLGR